MNGTRQGDFSRIQFDPRKRFAGVRVQQGRVQLDSDFNEATDILAHRLACQTADLVGASGAPASDPGFGITAERAWLELGIDQSFVLIGGSEGLLLPPPGSGEAGFGIEVTLLPRSEGPIFGCWVRREGDPRFKPVYGLRLIDGRLAFQRSGLSELASPPLPGLVGRPHTFAVSWSDGETVLEVDGEEVARDGNGVAVPHGPVLFLVGSRQAPSLSGLLGDLRLWNGARGAERRSLERGTALRGDEPGLVGWWSFEEPAGAWEGGGSHDGRIEDRGGLGHEALVRGSTEPPRFLPSELSIGAGRYYVDGHLCEAVEPAGYASQPDLPGAVLPQPRGREREHHLLFLDLWQRSISAVEDPSLREVALGGPDTTLRDQVVTQVRSLHLITEVERPTARELHDAWPGLVAGDEAHGKLLARRRHLATARLDNHLYRVEIHDGGDGHTAQVVEVRPAAGGGASALVLARWEPGWRVGQPVEVFRHGTGPQDQPRPLARVTALDPESLALTVDADFTAAPRADELRVRRVATFKWSRDNASLVVPIATLEAGNGLVRAQPTARGALGVEVGAWVEVVDDHRALLGHPEPLLRVEKVDPMKLQFNLSPAPGATGAAPGRHPFLRLWDQRGNGLTSWGVLPARGGDWQEIEAGIQVKFGYDGPYRTGDYWWLPSRALTQEIDWPRNDKGMARLLPPHGVDHHRTPLALLTYEPDGFRLLDLRRTFRPWVTGAVSKAGDWMEGPLDVRADAAVRGDLRVEGEVRAHDVYGALRSRDAVDTLQLVDRSVTREKLAEGVGLVPDGYSILGPVAEPPAGYRYSGWSLTLRPDEPLWVDRRQMPGGPPGPLASAALGGRVFSLLESGMLWEYDPESDLWARKADLPIPARRSALAPLGGKLFVAGGLEASGRASRRTFEYDPQADRWTERAGLQTGRSGFAFAACEGRLHALGGLRDSALGKCTTARHEVYEPLTDTWARRRPLPERLADSGSAALGGWLHLVGGEKHPLAGRWGRTLSAAHFAYHAGSDRWIGRRAPLATPRRGARLVATHGKLYAIGGESELGWLRDCESYDPGSDRWAALPPLHEAIEAPGATADAGVLYVCGALRAGGALIEECRVATQLYVHGRRQEGAARRGGAPAPPAPPSLTPPVLEGSLETGPLVRRDAAGAGSAAGGGRGFEVQPLSR